MKKRHGIEMYSLSEFDANDLPGSFASWDFGRRNGLPLWPEFAGGQYFEEKNFYTHLCPSSTAFEFPLKGELLIEHNDRITLALHSPGRRSQYSARGALGFLLEAFCGTLRPAGHAVADSAWFYRRTQSG